MCTPPAFEATLRSPKQAVGVITWLLALQSLEYLSACSSRVIFAPNTNWSVPATRRSRRRRPRCGGCSSFAVSRASEPCHSVCRHAMIASSGKGDERPTGGNRISHYHQLLRCSPDVAQHLHEVETGEYTSELPTGLVGGAQDRPAVADRGWQVHGSVENSGPPPAASPPA